MKNSLVRGKHIPMYDVVGFRADVDPEKLLKKLSELNASSNVEKGDSLHCISIQHFKILEDLVKFPEKIEMDSTRFQDIWEQCIKPVLLTWPKDRIFPALDILRWYLGRKATFKLNETVAKDVLNVVLSPSNDLLSNNTPETALRLTLRILSNCFLHPSLHKILLLHRENIIGILSNIAETSKSISEGNCPKY